MKRVALIAVLALAASACTIAVDIGVALERNGSGQIAVDIAADDEFHTLYRLTGREFEDLIASRGLVGGLSFTVKPGPVTHYSAESAVVPTATLESLLEGLAPGIGEVTITRSGTALEFDAQLEALTSIEDVAPYFVDSDPGQFDEDATVNVTLTMAGELDSSTATSEQDGRLTWTLPFSDTPTRLFASTRLARESASFPWSLAVLATTFVLAAGFLIAIRSGLTRTQAPAQPIPSTMLQPNTSPPEDQPVGPDSTPPEDQPVAPPAEMSEPPG